MAQIETLDRFQLVSEKKPRSEKPQEEIDKGRREFLANAGGILILGGLAGIVGGLGYGTYRFISQSFYGDPERQDEIDSYTKALSSSYEDLHQTACADDNKDELSEICTKITDIKHDLSTSLIAQGQDETNYQKDLNRFMLIPALTGVGALATGGVIFGKNYSPEENKNPK